MARNTFLGNQAETEGGSLRFCYFYGTLPTPTVADNVIVGGSAGQWGSALSVRLAQIVCENLTAYDNACLQGTGSAVTVLEGSLTLRDCIVVANAGGGVRSVDSILVTEYCDVWGNVGGDYHDCLPSATDVACDPEFCAPGSNDLHLRESSGCQGAGSNGGDIGALGVGCFTVPDVLLYDDFNDQDDVGWTVTSAGAATIRVESGRYVGRAESAGSHALSVVSPGTAPFADAAWRVSIRPESVWGSAAAVEVHFRYTDPDNSYFVRLDGGAGGELHKRLGGQPELLQTFAAPLPENDWTRIQLTSVSGELTGAILENDALRPLFVHDDTAAPLVAGTMALGVGTGLDSCTVRFDDVMILALSQPVTSAPGSEVADARQGLAHLDLRAYPVPFDRGLTIEFELAGRQRVVLDVFAVDGRRIATPLSGERPAGRLRTVWGGVDDRGRPVPSGVYFLRLSGDSEIRTRKVVKVRN